MRLDFLELLKRLNASQQSIQKIVAFALRHATRSADDIWDCIMTECARVSANAVWAWLTRQAPSNTRINILFLLDAFLADDFQTNAVAVAIYRTIAAQHLATIVDMIVPPDNWDAVLNANSTRQILASWRTKRVFDVGVLTSLLETADQRAAAMRERVQQGNSSGIPRLSHSEVIRRIEEDRERHKILREGSWKLPPMSYAHIPSPARQQPSDEAVASATDAPADAVAIEFDQAWECTSDLNEDDLEDIREDNASWWGSAGSGPSVAT